MLLIYVGALLLAILGACVLRVAWTLHAEDQGRREAEWALYDAELAEWKAMHGDDPRGEPFPPLESRP